MGFVRARKCVTQLWSKVAGRYASGGVDSGAAPVLRCNEAVGLIPHPEITRTPV